MNNMKNKDDGLFIAEIFWHMGLSVTLILVSLLPMIEDARSS
jgi:hypothetical protein